MKKGVLLFFLLLLVSACDISELPAEPMPPGDSRITGMVVGETFPNYAHPIKSFKASSGFDEGFYLNVEISDDIIYKQGYVSVDGRDWTLFELDGDNRYGNWLISSARKKVKMESDKLRSNNNYVLLYSCSESSGTWDCHGNGQWMIKRFHTLPPEPEELHDTADEVDDVYYEEETDEYDDSTGFGELIYEEEVEEEMEDTSEERLRSTDEIHLGDYFVIESKNVRDRIQVLKFLDINTVEGYVSFEDIDGRIQETTFDATGQESATFTLVQMGESFFGVANIAEEYVKIEGAEVAPDDYEIVREWSGIIKHYEKYGKDATSIGVDSHCNPGSVCDVSFILKRHGWSLRKTIMEGNNNNYFTGLIGDVKAPIHLDRGGTYEIEANIKADFVVLKNGKPAEFSIGSAWDQGEFSDAVEQHPEGYSTSTDVPRVVFRDVVLCSGDKKLERAAIYTDMGYSNYMCSESDLEVSRKQEQCYSDDSFDTYYVEECSYDEPDIRICPEHYDPVCGIPPGPDCPAGMYCVSPGPTTYGNDCKLEIADAVKQCDGACPCEEEEDGTVCPIPVCADPGEGCHYEYDGELGADGCPLNPCGILTCEVIEEEEDVELCPIPSCASPPDGCYYEYNNETGSDGCLLYPCGILTCEVEAEDGCIDTDGFDLLRHGVMTICENGMCEDFEDYCQSDGDAVDYNCEEYDYWDNLGYPEIHYDQIHCPVGCYNGACAEFSESDLSDRVYVGDYFLWTNGADGKQSVILMDGFRVEEEYSDYRVWLDYRVSYGGNMYQEAVHADKVNDDTIWLVEEDGMAVGPDYTAYGIVGTTGGQPSYLQVSDGVKLSNVACNDPDGSDEMVKSTTVFNSHQFTDEHTDNCFSYNELNEYFCEDGLIERKSITCPLGCSDGACVQSVCGDYVLQGSEECDGINLNNKNCNTFGYSYGTLECTSTCTFDKSDCTNTPPNPYYIGDVNQNGVMEAVDAQYVAAHVIGGTVPIEVTLEKADTNLDGVLTQTDAENIAACAVGNKYCYFLQREYDDLIALGVTYN